MLSLSVTFLALRRHVTNLEKSYADAIKQKDVTDDNKLLVVIRNLPESENENVLNKVIALSEMVCE
jgi:hypothetical protein